MAGEDVISLRVPRTLQPLLVVFMITLFAGLAIALVAAVIRSFHQNEPGTLGGAIGNHWQVVSVIGGLVIGSIGTMTRAILERIPRTADLHRLTTAMERMTASIEGFSTRLTQIEKVREDIAYFYGKIGGELPKRYGIMMGEAHAREIEQDEEEELHHHDS